MNEYQLDPIKEQGDPLRPDNFKPIEFESNMGLNKLGGFKYAQAEPVKVLPELNFFKAPEVPGWEYEDYRKWTDAVSPFDKEIKSQMEEKQKEIQVAVDMGAIPLEEANNQLQSYGEELFGKYEPKIVAKTSSLFENKQTKKIITNNQEIVTNKPFKVENVFNPSTYGNLVGDPVVELQSKIDNLKDELLKYEDITDNGIFDYNATTTKPTFDKPYSTTTKQRSFGEDKSALQSKLSLYEQAMQRIQDEYVSKEVQVNATDRTPGRQVTVGKNYVDSQFAPEIAFELSELKVGDMIPVDQSQSQIFIRDTRRGEHYAPLPTKQKFEDGEAPVYYYKVEEFDEKGNIKVSPVTKLATGVDELQEIEVGKPLRTSQVPIEKAASFDKLLSEKTGTKVSFFQESQDIYGDNERLQSTQPVLNLLNSNPALANEYIDYLSKDNRYKNVNPQSFYDLKNSFVDFYNEKIKVNEEKMKQLNIDPIELGNYRNSSYQVSAVQDKFRVYQSSKLAKIQRLEEERKNNPGNAKLKEEVRKNIAEYNASLNKYQEFYDKHKDNIELGNKPEIKKYNDYANDINLLKIGQFRLDKDLSMTEYKSGEGFVEGKRGGLLEGFWSATGPALLEAKNLSSYVARLIVNEKEVRTWDAYYQSSRETFKRAAEPLPEEDANGKTDWGAVASNTLNTAGNLIGQVAMMRALPKVRLFKTELPGLQRYMDDITGMYALMSLQTHTNYVEKAKNAGVKSAAGQHLYAAFGSAVDALSENIFSIRGFWDKMEKSALDVYKRKLKGDLMKIAPEIIEDVTSRSSSNKIAGVLKEFATKVGGNTLLNAGEETGEELLASYSHSFLNTIANNSFNTSLNDETMSLNETGRLYASMVVSNLLTGGLNGFSKMKSSANTMENRASVLMDLADQVGFDKVYGSIKDLHEQIKQGKAPAGVDAKFVEDMYRIFPYYAPNKPDGMSEAKWMLVRDKVAKVNMISGLMDRVDPTLQEGYKEQVKKEQEKINTILALSDKEAVDIVAEVRAKVKEELASAVNTEQEVNEQVNEEAPKEQVTVETETPGSSRGQVGTKSEETQDDQQANVLVPSGNGSWREEFNKTNDNARRNSILETIAQLPTSTEDELRDIYNAAKSTEKDTNRINWALANNTNTPQDVFDDIINSKALEKTASDDAIQSVINKRNSSVTPSATQPVQPNEPVAQEQVTEQVEETATPEQQIQNLEEQKKQEIIQATKPTFSLDFIPEKQLQNKQIQVTFEDAETGEQIFRPQAASKVQASIKARYEILNKLINCIG